jgi:biotin carboxyl carrier protein
VRLTDSETLTAISLPSAHAAEPAAPPVAPIAPAANRTIAPGATQPELLNARKPAASTGAGTVVAPLPGLIESILVASGDYVKRGDPLLVLEAMKMRNTIQATEAGVIQQIWAQPGQTVRHGDALLSIEREEH